MSTVKDRVKQLCYANHTNIKQLERELGFANGTIQKWDKFNPRMDKLSAVAVYFGVPIEALTGDQMPEQKENPATSRSDEEFNDAIRRGKYSHFIDLLDMSTQETQQEVLTLLISRLHSRVNQDEQK